MDDILAVVNDKVVAFSYDLGLTPDTFGLGEMTFSLTIVIGFVVIHFVLFFMGANASSSRNNKFKALSQQRQQELLKNMKERVDKANQPSQKSGELEKISLELERLKETKKSLLEKHSDAERHAQNVQAKDGEYKMALQQVTDEHSGIYQQVVWKEQELARMHEAYRNQMAYQDKSQELYKRKDDLNKLNKELAGTKQKRDKLSKETEKLQKEMENINNTRQQMQLEIDNLKGTAETYNITQANARDQIDLIRHTVKTLKAAQDELAKGKSDEDQDIIVNELFDVEKASFRVETAQAALVKNKYILEEEQRVLEDRQKYLYETQADQKKNLDHIRELEKQKKTLNMKLGVIQEFFAHKDVKVRQELAKEKELRSAMEADYTNFKDREAYLDNELAEYKQTRADLLKKHEMATRERSQSINKIEREAHDSWLKWRETERKAKDLERETKSLQDQLAAKAEHKSHLEKEIHDIHVRQERKAAKRHQEVMDMRARQERARILVRMRGPEGEEARRTGRVQNISHPRGHAPLIHPQKQQQLRNDSPQLSPIQGSANRPYMNPSRMPMAPQMPRPPGVQTHFPGPPGVQPHFPHPPHPNQMAPHPQYFAPPPNHQQQQQPRPQQAVNGHHQHNENDYMA